MKTLIFTLFFALGMAATVSAQTTESVTLKAGKKITAKKSKLKIKFISVTEDSRCPEGVNCIWAGNAKVKVEVIGARSTRVFEFNTTVGQRGDQFDVWAITIDSLTPYPKSGVTIDPKKYVAKFTIVRLQR